MVQVKTVNGETIEISTLIAIGGLMLALLALVSGVHLRLGQLISRVDQLERRFDRQAEGNRETREELRQEIHQTREEFRQELREMREENRRNHQQLLHALAHHTHDPATGFATFPFPPGTDPPDHL